ncbi:ROK family protein [Pseudobacter ginsenosidimutans]|uniref:N-acetylglucosamine kinase n=1 Tax=Pseudobacter ginsenosidimutans TaxID=661488 RepID=A0A4Q7MSL9_9BACT|nr:ROK family protein [Pseudobacter ginsenosidimutans]QEC41408.1 ROK family protein [Pseudobacter ginsenosidimutans]RZS71812.1 N-acetylglucosamine kinase [Pseudobacter ginsenosidimutans]
MNDPLWGIDLGGTKIEGVILPSIEEATPLLRLRIDTERKKGYEHILQQIKTLVQQMQEQSGLQPTRIGFGTPGVLDPGLQTMKNCNSTALNGQPLKKDLEELLNVPVVLANDANCFALAETHWGVVKEKVPGAAVVFGIILGTGVGGGIVVNGKLWNGRHGIAGEWGHNFLDESGGPCYCGKTGCVETILSGPALERFYESISGTRANLKEITQYYLSQQNDAAKQTIERLAWFFGKAVSVVTNLLDPDIIVVGGGVGNIDVLYTSGIQSLQHHIFNNRLDVPVLKPAMGDSAGVFGAAALVS